MTPVGTKLLRMGLVLAVLAASLRAGSVEAAEFDFAKFHHELGLRLVSGRAIWDGNVRLHGIMPRFGWVLVGPGNPRWAGVGVTVALEGIFAVAEASHTGCELGLTPLLKLSYPVARRALLFVEGGAGIIGEFIDTPDVSHHFNFTPQAGAGVEIALAPQWSLTVAYRYRHSSNAGLYTENPAFDVHLVQAGLTYYF
jgi:hypothetical protein